MIFRRMVYSSSKLVKLNLTLLVITFFMAQTAHAFKELAPEQIKKILSGEIIIEEKSIKNASWPEYTAYGFFSASPLESIAVYTAYNYQHKYVPGLLKSRVLSQKTAREARVEYEMHVPLLANAKYINDHYLSQRQDSFVVTWKQVKSNRTLINQGSASFKKFRGGSLFIYNSRVEPDSFLAPMLKSSGKSNLLESLKAIQIHTEKLKKENPKLLSELISKIKDSLKGIKIY